MNFKDIELQDAIQFICKWTVIIGFLILAVGQVIYMAIGLFSDIF